MSNSFQDNLLLNLPNSDDAKNFLDSLKDSIQEPEIIEQMEIDFNDLENQYNEINKYAAEFNPTDDMKNLDYFSVRKKYIESLETLLVSATETNNLLLINQTKFNLSQIENALSLDILNDYIQKIKKNSSNKEINRIKLLAREKLKINKKFMFRDPKKIEKDLNIILDKKTSSIFFYCLSHFIYTVKLEKYPLFISELLNRIKYYNNEDKFNIEESSILINNIKNLVENYQKR